MGQAIPSGYRIIADVRVTGLHDSQAMYAIKMISTSDGLPLDTVVECYQCCHAIEWSSTPRFHPREKGVLIRAETGRVLSGLTNLEGTTEENPRRVRSIPAGVEN